MKGYLVVGGKPPKIKPGTARARQLGCTCEEYTRESKIRCYDVECQIHGSPMLAALIKAIRGGCSIPGTGLDKTPRKNTIPRKPHRNGRTVRGAHKVRRAD